MAADRAVQAELQALREENLRLRQQLQATAAAVDVSPLPLLHELGPRLDKAAIGASRGQLPCRVTWHLSSVSSISLSHPSVCVCDSV
jgi:hypothetical protein